MFYAVKWKSSPRRDSRVPDLGFERPTSIQDALLEIKKNILCICSVFYRLVRIFHAKSEKARVKYYWINHDLFYFSTF